MSALASQQQDILIAPCNIYLELCTPEQIVCTVVAVQQDDVFGVHDHPAWKAYLECDVALGRARHRAILELMLNATLHHLVSVANDNFKPQQLVGQNCRGRPRTVWNDVVLFDIHKL